MKKMILWLGALGCASWTAAQVPETVSEKDFLTDMPIVLSVSRLPQPLNETPGAVTVLDREMIRLSGARDVADLMRLVPGFQTSSSFERVAPQASYHGAFTSYANHLQVLVDGRSVYSPYFIGSTEVGLQTVALEDIERIEVLRGSNSASYGARAMLGVINIVTRHTVDTLGAAVGIANGQNGIRDSRASFGWAQNDATFRLGVDRRGDDGLTGANGHNEMNRVNFRADLKPSGRDQVQLRVGTSQILSGKGGAGGDGPADIKRDQLYGSDYGQLDWQRNLGIDEDLLLRVSRGKETNAERILINQWGMDFEINANGQSISDELSLQHTIRLNEKLRAVWGAELRRESITSQSFYSTDQPIVTRFGRLFGSVEWRAPHNLVVNAGALAETNSLTGDNFSPRLMLNWNINNGQTLRAGVSTGFRPPSTFEEFSKWSVYMNGAPTDPSLLPLLSRSSGNLRNENLLSRELGYLGNFPHIGLDLDVRIFNEKIKDLITQVDNVPKNYANTDDFTIQGLEYQLKWKIWPGAQLMWGQTYIRNDSSNSSQAASAPTLSNSLNLFQKLPAGLNLSLMHQNSSAAILAGNNSENQKTLNRTDLRLSAPLRFGAQRGEVALVVQNLGAPYSDFFPQFQFERRAFVILRVEN